MSACKWATNNEPKIEQTVQRANQRGTFSVPGIAGSTVRRLAISMQIAMQIGLRMINTMCHNVSTLCERLDRALSLA